jgi:hypothetical protein
VKAYNVKNVSGFNVLDNSITGDKLTDEAGDQLTERAVDIAVDEAGDYTDQKATETRRLAAQDTEEYIGSKGGYGTYDAYIKAYCDRRYMRA